MSTERAQHTVDLVVLDLAERKRKGAQHYGQPHSPDLPRDHLLDAYEEVLDAAIYLRAEIERRKAAA